MTIDHGGFAATESTEFCWKTHRVLRVVFSVVDGRIGRPVFW